MIAEILSIGTELLMGQVTNTDAQYISVQLSALGITQYRQVTVGDNPARVQEALKAALSRADIVITTGGLGPTEDDLTKEMVAQLFNKPMVLHKETEDKLHSFFEGIGRVMTPNNLRQAYFPEGSYVLPNRRGTAPGCIVSEGGKFVVTLPGPPHELIDMFEQAVMPYLESMSGDSIQSVFLRIFGVGESEVETRLLDLFHSDNPTLALYCSPAEVLARITYRCPKGQDASVFIKPLEDEIRKRLGDCVYGEGRNTSIASVVVSQLMNAGQTLAIAESCTGGMISSQIVDISGASKVLLEGHVTYSNESKRKTLGVREETLTQYGAVSKETAQEMAEAVRLSANSDWGIATTGIAGPDGGTDAKPVGLVYIAIANKDVCQVHEMRFRGDRQRIRLLSTLHALDKLRKAMNRE